MIDKLLTFAALSLFVAGCSTAPDAAASSATDTAESPLSTCGRTNEACCTFFKPGESGFLEIYCTSGLTCTTVGAFQKCVKPGTTPVAGPPTSACGFKGHLCCPSTAVGEVGDHAPFCNPHLGCATVSGIPTCVDPVAPSPVPAATLCGGKGQRCCTATGVGESGGSHSPTCNTGLSCHSTGGLTSCN